MYRYEHTDGSLHDKPDIVVDMAGGPESYFEGPFVKRWWKVEEGETKIPATEAAPESS